MYLKKWIKAALIRAVKTVAQTAVGTIGASAVLAEVNWYVVLSASMLAGVVSLLTSVAGLPEADMAYAAELSARYGEADRDMDNPEAEDEEESDDE